MRACAEAAAQRGSRSRRVEHATLVNARDLGGLRVRGGGVTRFDRVLRCGNLARLSDADARWLARTVGVRLAIDLRSARERAADGGTAVLAAHGIRCVHAPAAVAGPYLGGERLPDPRHYAASYRELALVLGPALRETLAALAAGDELPLAFFCTAGKDRTGVLAAVLLWSIGVTPGEVARDYALTARALRPRLDDFAPHWQRKGLSRAEYARRLEARPAAALALLAWLDAEFGSPAALLHALDVDAAVLAPARRALVAELAPARRALVAEGDDPRAVAGGVRGCRG